MSLPGSASQEHAFDDELSPEVLRQLPGGVLSTETDPRIVANVLNASPAFAHFGLRVQLPHEVGDHIDWVGEAIPFIVEIPRIQPYHRGGTTVLSINGGVIAMVCDLSLGLTIMAPGLPLAKGSGVGRLNIRMGRPIEGRSARAVATITAIRRNLIYARTVVQDEQGRDCVRAEGTIFRGR